MTIENRKELESEVVSRILNNAPVSELLRIYSLSLQASLSDLDDADFLQAVLNSGFTDLLEKYTTPEMFFEGDDDEGPDSPAKEAG